MRNHFFSKKKIVNFWLEKRFKKVFFPLLDESLFDHICLLQKKRKKANFVIWQKKENNFAGTTLLIKQVLIT